MSLIRFEPVYQSYVWGGERIASHFQRNVDLPKIAESWEISDREEGMSVAINGPFKGKTLRQLMKEMGEELLGQTQVFEKFPLLIKIIDAKENLSIQVHPDAASAAELKGEPKDEAWIMLDDSTVLAGLQEGTDAKQFKKAIREKRAHELLRKFELKKGDALHIPGGRVHAICAGSLIFEVQQNSNTTYRLYDWGRDRPLHLEEGLTAVRWDDQHTLAVPPHHLCSDLHHQIVTLSKTPHFIIERIDVFDTLHVGQIPKSFQIFFGFEGQGQIEVDGHKEPLFPGVSYLVPASAHNIAFEGKCQALRVRLAIH